LRGEQRGGREKQLCAVNAADPARKMLNIFSLFSRQFDDIVYAGNNGVVVTRKTIITANVQADEHVDDVQILPRFTTTPLTPSGRGCYDGVQLLIYQNGTETK